MIEYKILKALGSRKSYESARRFIDSSVLSPHAVRTLEEIDGFYKADESAEVIDWDIVKERIIRSVEAVPKHKQAFEDYLHTVVDLTDVSEINVVREVRDVLLDKHTNSMIDAGLNGNREEFDRQMERYLEIKDHGDLNLEVEEKYKGTSVMDLVEQFDPANRIRLGPRLLSDKLGGGARRGHHIIVAARPEVGKSLVAINMLGSVLQQGYKAVYVGNEDPLVDLMMRLVSNLSGMNEEQIMANPDEAMEVARANGYDNVTFVGMAPGTIEAIGEECRKEKPDVLFIDQLRNIGANTENNTQRLDVVAQGARKLARQHSCLVVSVTQAGDSAENKLVLNMGDIDGSNTGIPGACDVMVMVGCNDEHYRANLRTFSLPKNKIGRFHGSFAVRIDPTLTRIHSDNIPSGIRGTDEELL
jgi:KaiC/GvpD/RAD55 family RecA-like ATPase